MNKRKLVKLMGMCLAALLVCAACGGQRASLKIVTSFPMRGSAVGRSIVDAIALAVADAQGQVDGYPIELIQLDGGNEQGQWDAGMEKANVEKAIGDPNVVAYIGPLHSAAAKVSIPLASRAGLTHISPSAAWPGLTQVGFAPGEPAKFYPTGQRTFYRVCPTDESQATAAVQWAKALGFERIYILDDGEAYGKGLADLFEQRAKIAGLTVRGHETIDVTATDFIGVMSRLWLTPPPDLVFFSGYAPNGVLPLLKQMRTIKPPVTSVFMGTESLVDTAFVAGAGEHGNGVYATMLGLPPAELTDGGRQFVQNYQAKYGQMPEATAALGYDAMQVVLQALSKAQTKDRAGLAKAMALPQRFEGTYGPFSFDQNGDTTLNMVSGVQIRNGQFVFVQLLVGSR